MDTAHGIDHYFRHLVGPSAKGVDRHKSSDKESSSFRLTLLIASTLIVGYGNYLKAGLDAGGESSLAK